MSRLVVLSAAVLILSSLFLSNSARRAGAGSKERTDESVEAVTNEAVSLESQV